MDEDYFIKYGEILAQQEEELKKIVHESCHNYIWMKSYLFGYFRRCIYFIKSIDEDNIYSIVGAGMGTCAVAKKQNNMIYISDNPNENIFSDNCKYIPFDHNFKIKKNENVKE